MFRVFLFVHTCLLLKIPCSGHFLFLSISFRKLYSFTLETKEKQKCCSVFSFDPVWVQGCTFYFTPIHLNDAVRSAVIVGNVSLILFLKRDGWL